MQVNFREWDGLIRLCFGRKNKTLGGFFNENGVGVVNEELFDV